jgi:hypothetical protein
VTPPRGQNSQAGNPQGSMVTNVNGTSYSVNANGWTAPALFSSRCRTTPPTFRPRNQSRP